MFFCCCCCCCCWFIALYVVVTRMQNINELETVTKTPLFWMLLSLLLFLIELDCWFSSFFVCVCISSIHLFQAFIYCLFSSFDDDDDLVEFSIDFYSRGMKQRSNRYKAMINSNRTEQEKKFGSIRFTVVVVICSIWMNIVFFCLVVQNVFFLSI